MYTILGETLMLSHFCMIYSLFRDGGTRTYMSPKGTGYRRGEVVIALGENEGCVMTVTGLVVTAARAKGRIS